MVLWRASPRRLVHLVKRSTSPLAALRGEVASLKTPFSSPFQPANPRSTENVPKTNRLGRPRGRKGKVT